MSSNPKRDFEVSIPPWLALLKLLVKLKPGAIISHAARRVMISIFCSVTLTLLIAYPTSATSYNYSNTTPVAIPDTTIDLTCTNPVSTTINITDSYTISDIDAGFVIEHTFEADLTAVLRSPSGTSVFVFSNMFTAGDGEDLNARVDDEASSFLLLNDQSASVPYPDVTSTPIESLTAFDGEEVNGIWTLEVCDLFLFDTGTINGFYLHITDSAPPVDPMIVTSTADTNTIGTLRYAINHANSNAGDDDITFNISGAGPHTISLTSNLPIVTDSGVSIDGTSQSGASCGQLSTGTPHTLLIRIDGSGATGRIFDIRTPNITLRALSITGAPIQAFRTNGSADNSLFECLYVGIAPDGITKGPNASLSSDSPAVRIQGTDNVTIRNSLISGNDTQSSDDGIQLNNVLDATIEGNIIGLDASGTIAIGNGDTGIDILGGSSNVIIGGSTAETRNIISGNGGDGIIVAGTAISGNNIFGNYIGLNQTASSTIGNGSAGVVVTSSANAAIYGNAIFGNGGLGIDIDADGVSPNDSGDLDTGPNGRLNFPVINSFGGNGTTAVEYDINLETLSNTDGYRIDFFKNSLADGTGFGEGEFHLGSVDISHAGGDLNFSGSFIANSVVSVGDIISATTTRKIGPLSYDITSEFSFNTTAISSGTLASLNVTKSVAELETGEYSIPGNDMVYSFTVTNTGDGPADTDSIVLIDRLPSEIEFFNGDYDGAGPSSDRVGFTESGTSLTFDPNVDAAFSNAVTKPVNFAACSYSPTIGYDPAVTYICLNPKGQMIGGDPDPAFSLSFRARIK